MSRQPKNPFHPGEILLEEFLDPMKVTQAAFAQKLCWTKARLNELIKGKRKIGPEIAEGLSAAFGTTAEYWTNLETAYQYWILRKRHDHTPDSERKAKLMTIAPYRELIRRGWVDSSPDIDVLEEIFVHKISIALRVIAG